MSVGGSTKRLYKLPNSFWYKTTTIIKTQNGFNVLNYALKQKITCKKVNTV